MRAAVISILLLFVVGVMPATAQEYPPLSEEELGYIDTINTAYNGLLSQPTFQVAIEQTIYQDIDFQDPSNPQANVQIIEQATRYEVQTNGIDALSLYRGTMQQTTTQKLISSQYTTDLQMDMLFWNGEHYLRYDERSAQLSDGLLPSGWVRYADLQIPGMNFDFTENLSGLEAFSLYEVSPDTVVNITKLPKEQLDEQAVDVYLVTWDTQQLFSLTGLNQFFDADGSTQGDIYSSVFDAVRERITFSHRIWIAEGLVQQVDFSSSIKNVELEAVGQQVYLSQQTRTTTRFFAFGDPVTIDIPAELQREE